jgi:PAS domain S-box-containing protein
MPSVAEFKARRDVPVIVANKFGLVTYVNHKFQEYYGWSEIDLLGKPLTTIIPQALHDAHNLGFSRFLITKTPTLLGKTLSLKIVTKDGKELNAEHCIVADENAGAWEFAATIVLEPGS